jgi:hypothetical protein
MFKVPCIMCIVMSKLLAYANPIIMLTYIYIYIYAHEAFAEN